MIGRDPYQRSADGNVTQNSEEVEIDARDADEAATGLADERRRCAEGQSEGEHRAVRDGHEGEKANGDSSDFGFRLGVAVVGLIERAVADCEDDPEGRGGL